jgi:UDP-N-acetylmuramoyl-L-alanyl-D-glutamate--2,6-diaminopimelate ligase
MDEYFASKRVLFEGCGTEAPRVAVLNADDEYGRALVKVSRAKGSKVLTYGSCKADFCAEKIQITGRGTRFDLVSADHRVPLWSPLIGRVNVYNILAAAAAAYGRNCPEQSIVQGIANLNRVPGRFERVDCGQPFLVVVDYAHTDDALKNLTALAREFVSRSGSSGRVITLFGCGGDRDRAKRPLMGEAAGRGSDLVVLTSDNPRSEDPRAIINDALVGLQRAGTKYTIEPDRKAAIAVAIGAANPGDIVLLAGKGHEKVQVTRSGPAPFDDVQAARDVLSQAGYNCAQAAMAGEGR